MYTLNQLVSTRRLFVRKHPTSYQEHVPIKEKNKHGKHLLADKKNYLEILRSLLVI